MGKEFRVGFIGAGGIAHAHGVSVRRSRAWKSSARRDVSAPSLKLVKEQYKVTRLYEDYHEMLRKEKDIDAVGVCTPNGLHAANTIAALKAGKHVLVEKPMAMNATQAQAMLDAAKKAKKQLIVGFQFRFDPRTKVIREQIADGEFGKILLRALPGPSPPRDSQLGRVRTQGSSGRRADDRHRRARHGNGPLRHRLAQADLRQREHLDLPRQQASDIASQWPGWDYKTYTVEDMAVGMIRFEGGTMLTIEASFVAHIEKDIWNFQVMGEKGGATWDPIHIFKDDGGLHDEHDARAGSASSAGTHLGIQDEALRRGLPRRRSKTKPPASMG